jgi:hypothetical protein
VPLNHFYETVFNYGLEGFWKKSHIELQSALPFFVEINDPEKKLQIEQTPHLLKIDLVKDCYYARVNEPGNSMLMPEQLTWVAVSSLKDFIAFGKRLSTPYETVATQPLPEGLQGIVKHTAQETDEIVQLNTLTSLLAEKVRYMGDWRSVEGRLFPRSLREIMHQGMADCKDFASMTVAMLRALGYQAHVALVERGNMYPSVPTVNTEALAGFQSFNHAIVRAVGKSGTVYWIDPTNVTSMVQAIFPDIANRPALVLNPEAILYTQIPEIMPDQAKFISRYSVKNQHEDLREVQGSISLEGVNALSLTGALLFNAHTTFEEWLINYLSGDMTQVGHTVTLPDLSSRIVRDLKIDYAYKVKNKSFVTNYGRAFVLPAFDVMNQLIESTEDMVSALYLDYPNRQEKHALLYKADATGIDALNCVIDSPWISVERRYTSDPEGVRVDDVLIIKKRFILPGESKLPEFIALKEKLQKYFMSVAIVFK